MCERTIAEYEEELCPTKEEKERQHEKHQVVLHTTDIHQLIGHQEECLPHLQGDSFTSEDPQPSHMKEEEEGECVVGQEEDDVSKFPLTVVSVKTEEHEDKAPESSQLHHSPNVQQPLHIKEEEDDPQPTYIKEEEEDSQPTHMKEEEEDPHMKEEEEGECVVGQEEDDVSKFPLTVVSVKTEEHEDKAPESSQLHHSPMAECACCHELEAVARTMEQEGVETCIIDHPGFQSVCLDEWVLQTAYYAYKQQYGVLQQQQNE
ncbi:uncharacterized protein [Nerophis lumbriciformis]|uniref:uncharacterized protein n=1 Tax=Nerophis lumbriciformis TaxID=546530 RepID=UPI003BABA344